MSDSSASSLREKEARDDSSIDLEKRQAPHSDHTNDDQPAEQAQQQVNKAPEKDPNLVELEGPDDPLNPQNLPTHRKWLYALVLGSLTLVVTFASTVFSTAANATAKEFGVSEEVMTLGTGLFVFGFATGPFVYGPMSEVYGRKTPMLIGYFIFILFQIPVGVAQNVETILVCRFLQGVFCSGPLAVIGGYLADFFAPVERGLAVAIFMAATQVGPILGPVIGGFVTESELGWRWTAWLTMIMAGCSLFLATFIVPETFVPLLLTRKARRLRYETGNWALHSKMEETPVDLGIFLHQYVTKPAKMLFLEPILLLLTLYMSFIYGFIYLLFEAFPISFIEQRGWTEGVGALPFIGIIVGVGLATIYIVRYTNTTLKQNFIKHGRVIPEDRIYPCIWGGMLLPIGTFWFAWTSYPSITPWPQIISIIPIGAGIYILFLQITAYAIDVYLMHANSAISALTIVRSLVAGGFPVFAGPMYHNLGVQWASSLLGFLALAFLPVPIIFYIYGAKIRKLSKFAPSL